MANERSSPRRLNFSNVIPSTILQTIAIDVVFPYMVYQLFAARLATPLALLLVALLPLGHMVWQFNQQRRLDLIALAALYVLFWIMLGALIPDTSPLLSIILHYVLPIGILGILTLLTRWMRMPLLFYIDRYCHAHTPDHVADYTGYWQESTDYRQMIFRMNSVWGFGQILFSLCLLALFFLIPIDFSASIILVATCLFYIVLTMWSVQHENSQVEQWDKMNSEQDPSA